MQTSDLQIGVGKLTEYCFPEGNVKHDPFCWVRLEFSLVVFSS